MSLKRAISNDDKLRKRQLIIDAAAGLFQASDFNGIKMIDVAKAAGMAKGTLFLYFKTKEELFLELSRQCFARFFSEADKAMEDAVAIDAGGSVEIFIDALMAFLEKDPTMLRLASITTAILEQNISYEAARDFKIFLNNSLEHTGRLIEQYFPQLKRGDGSKLLLWNYSIVIGLQHISDPSEICKQVLLNEDIPHLKVEFKEHFSQILAAMLSGMGCE